MLSVAENMIVSRMPAEGAQLVKCISGRSISGTFQPAKVPHAIFVVKASRHSVRGRHRSVKQQTCGYALRHEEQHSAIPLEPWRQT